MDACARPLFLEQTDPDALAGARTPGPRNRRDTGPARLFEKRNLGHTFVPTHLPAQMTCGFESGQPSFPDTSVERGSSRGFSRCGLFRLWFARRPQRSPEAA